MSEGKKKNDLIFIAVILAVTVLLGLTLFFIRAEGDSVVVTLDGEEIGRYSLSVDRVVDISDGESHNRLVIRDGKAYVEEADCPDGICVNHRPISRDRESIVCLPNRVVITVYLSDDDGPDIIM